MLRRLSVSNYILIDALEIEFDGHLNIITGETGAGKSILLGALGLLLGNKNEGTTLRDPQRNCVIEALFDIEAYGLQPFFEENDLDYAGETVIRRIITPAGKSRAYVNDLPVQLAQLREFGSRLIDIHSQHQTLILASETFRTRALDTIAGNATLLKAYREHFDRLQSMRRELARQQAEAETARRDEEWLRFQSNELQAAGLRIGEMEELEREQTLLANADRIGEAIATIRNAFDSDGIGILEQLKNAELQLGRLRDSYPHAAEFTERLHSVLEELKDIGAALADDSQRIETNPERLQQVDDRIAALHALGQKYRANDESELIALRDRCLAQLDAIVHSDEALSALQKQIDAEHNATELAASELHRRREQAASAFAEQTAALLVRLGMPDVRFEVAVADSGELSADGRDRIDFLFSANRTTPPTPVERTASGGELSRVMLAVKALLAHRMQLPTILFDEIDTGVSGRIADAMGEIICTLSQTMQVINITHLPQVASKGSTHFIVYKRDGETRISRLTPEERITEIAKMLSGNEVTEAALAQARILLGEKKPEK
ncbi:DNA repair protein RecN [uncultured Alistipes sp.]|uniref:DNA repair protein RecN n=1 Tax=uncultured Alistipes sp. TaxID=538949 RepID=UPI00260710C2|nr:DNA repair protein RecN [uncultured Alistipes sp.]